MQYNSKQVAEKENMTTVHVPIPKEKHKYIIGKSGRTVTQLSEQFGVQVRAFASLAMLQLS